MNTVYKVKIKILLKICFIGFNTTDIWLKMLILETKFNSQGKLKYTYLHSLLLTNKNSLKVESLNIFLPSLVPNTASYICDIYSYIVKSHFFPKDLKKLLVMDWMLMSF